MNWSIADKAIGARVMEIGASLSEGNNLYLDLQYMYSSSNQDTSVNITDVWCIYMYHLCYFYT